MCFANVCVYFVPGPTVLLYSSISMASAVVEGDADGGGGGSGDGEPDTLITSNDRAFVCSTCTVAGSKLYYSGLNGVRSANFNPSPNITFNGEFLDIDRLQADVSRVMAALNDNIAKYKQWLTEKQEMFEQYFTEYDASEELFNKLNLIVPQIKKVLKSLTDWYANVQDIVSDVWDNSRAYADAKNLLLSYGLQYEQSYSIGLSINPVTLAKKNRTKAKSLHKQKTKALNAETAIRQALFRLESELSAFNQGVIRTPNGKFVNLVELGETIGSLYDRGSPLVRVQQELAQIINTSEIKVTLHAGMMPNINEVSNRESFVQTLGPTEVPNEYVLIKDLQEIADNELYTVNTRPAVDKRIAFAEEHVKTETNKSKLTELTREIRGAVPTAVLNKLRVTMRQKDAVYDNAAYIKRLLKKLHPKDKQLLKPKLNELLRETLQIAEGFMRNDRDGTAMEIENADS